MRRFAVTISLVFLVLLVVPSVTHAAGRAEAENDRFSIGVFVPGVVDGSPTYEMMVNGVRAAAEEEGETEVFVVEGGFNQATWEESVMSMAASGRYDVIVTSNPSMPEIAQAVTSAIPGVKFIVLDGFLEGNDRIHTVLFNQREQAYLSGYFAGLVTTDPSGTLRGRNTDLQVGLLAGQEYPIMNEVILTGYREGATAVDPAITVDFRVLGNWFDAGKAQEIATDMISRGSDVILTIAGGGNQGVVSAARERGIYVLWYDDTGYDEAPGIVIGSSLVRQDLAAHEATRAAIRGNLSYGSARILGVADGAVGFDTEHPEFLRAVPQQLVDEIEALLARLHQGDLVLEMPVPGR
jgi:riboflavin transport system substrate-binding protein